MYIMSDNFLLVPGQIIALDELKISKARDLAFVLASKGLPYVELVECRKAIDTNEEVVVVKIEVELCQRKVYDIRKFERVAVIFDPHDLEMPKVLSLRPDFPLTPHLYLGKTEFPRRLCLYEETYSELKLRWTPIGFLERIREWFALTAKGKLHGEDQPLEPLLTGPFDKIVIPFDLFKKDVGEEVPELLTIYRVNEDDEELFLIANRVKEISLKNQESAFVATAIIGQPQTHGIIKKTPETINELHNFMCQAGIDLITELRKRLRTWYTDKPFQKILDTKLILLIALPKTRDKKNTPEAVDVWAFACIKTVKEIGTDIGVFEVRDGGVGLLITPDQSKHGKSSEIYPLITIYSFSRDMAANLNGFPKGEYQKIVAIGVGALGSQVFMNLVRSGFGKWTLIDEDNLLPHNLARHELTGLNVGRPKAKSLAFIANETVEGETFANAIVADIVYPGKFSEMVKQALKETDVILDMSTSIAVARLIARDIDSVARRISMFLNPSGNDVVILVEDKERTTPLDYLEMQYYRQLLLEPILQNHLKRRDGRIRYANACRDFSSTIAYDLISLHSAICSRGLRNMISEDNAKIAIWQADLEDISIKSYKFSPEKMLQIKLDDWTICTDKWFYNKIFKLRSKKLPNETGGILIGSFDMQRKIVYILDTIPSPPDSQEWPTVYIRGCQGLRQKMENIEEITSQMLEYVGEWHSHPNGYGCKPSLDDREAFNQLSSYMNPEGFPAIMLIVGDSSELLWNVGIMQ